MLCVWSNPGVCCESHRCLDSQGSGGVARRTELFHRQHAPINKLSSNQARICFHVSVIKKRGPRPVLAGFFLTPEHYWSIVKSFRCHQTPKLCKCLYIFIFIFEHCRKCGIRNRKHTVRYIKWKVLSRLLPGMSELNHSHCFRSEQNDAKSCVRMRKKLQYSASEVRSKLKCF